MVSGNYVKDFWDASHALPDGMHMNADYPFMLPLITAYDGKTVTIQGYGGQVTTFQVASTGATGQCGSIVQSSSFERLLNRQGTTFIMRPFKDQNTPSIRERAQGSTP